MNKKKKNKVLKRSGHTFPPHHQKKCTHNCCLQQFKTISAQHFDNIWTIFLKMSGQYFHFIQAIFYLGNIYMTFQQYLVNILKIAGQNVDDI